MASAPTLRLVGGPTALITYGGLRLLTDPTFDPPGEYPRPGTEIVLSKLDGPAVELEDVMPVDAVLVSHDHHSDNLDHSGRGDALARGTRAHDRRRRGAARRQRRRHGAGRCRRG